MIYTCTELRCAKLTFKLLNYVLKNKYTVLLVMLIITYKFISTFIAKRCYETYGNIKHICYKNNTNHCLKFALLIILVIA